MSEATERTEKLLIFAGDEGSSFEARDFKKVVDVIVGNYLSVSRPSYEQFLVEILSNVIRRIPLKQHLYSGLTSEIRKINPQLAVNILRLVVKNLENDINSLKLHESINGVLYLAELMNLEKLNSQCFLDILDDIVSYLENNKNPSHRNFFVILYSRALPYFANSLNKKVFFEFKKQLEKVRKFLSKNSEFIALFDSTQKGNVHDASIVFRIYEKGQEQSNEDQIQENLKLNISVKDEQKFEQIEYLSIIFDESDKLYEEFVKNEGPLFMANVEQIFALMEQNSNFLVQKLIMFIGNEQEKTSFLQRYIVDLIFSKALKSKTTIVESYTLLKLIASNRVYAEFFENTIKRGFNFENEEYGLESQMKFAELVSFTVNNWPIGTNDMSDVGSWDWDKFLEAETKEENAVKFTAKKNVLVQIICQKIELLNEGYSFPHSMKKFTLPNELKNSTTFKSEKLEIFENFVELLNRKANSDEILEAIKNQSEYEIFLEALFLKTSLSHTHLEVLLGRYEKVFLKEKQENDWNLLTIIRSFWSKSFFHRRFYLETVIERGYVDFPSYVKYISKVETANEEEAQWVKIELNELNNLFSQKPSTLIQ